MKVYDISQELFGCAVYPGDPVPCREMLSSMAEGALYNLTALSLCAHNGTHIDAPYHFIADGKTVDQLPLEIFVGSVFVAEHQGEVTASDAARILERAKQADAQKRILLKALSRRDWSVSAMRSSLCSSHT